MQILYFVLVSIIAVGIYRQGLKDGQRVASGEKVQSMPTRIFNKKQKESEIEKGLKNIIFYGLGGDKK
ncbi:MAG: hypothetical protein GX800_10180 [Clostridiaceae bacterium]|nr:hypothetical protein [Clostridiaceae bacterium]